MLRGGNPAEIIVTSPGQSLSVDAIMEEQDTFLLLGTYPVISETKEKYETLVKKMEQQKPLEPGQLLVRKTSPVRFVAINYDIENKPICCEEWIESSLKKLFAECNNLKIISLAMPLPGKKYGNISRDTSMELLKKILLLEKAAYPEKIFILYEKE